MLVRWCPDAVSMSRVLQLTAIWGADVVSLRAQNMSFGMLLASTLAPWGTIQRSKGDLVLEVLQKYNFSRILGFCCFRSHFLCSLWFWEQFG